MTVSSVLQGKQMTVFTTSDKNLNFQLKINILKNLYLSLGVLAASQDSLVRQVVRVTNDFFIL